MIADSIEHASLPTPWGGTERQTLAHHDHWFHAIALELRMAVPVVSIAVC
jgi:hypothetical protein